MRQVAFLRAINVGRRVVTMARLRALFEDLGLSGVETVIASGNVMFDAAARSGGAIERRIAAHLRQALGYEVATFVRSVPQLASVVAGNPFSGRHGRAGETCYVGFLAEPASQETIARVHAAQADADTVVLNGRELYWLLRGSFRDSSFGGPRLEKLLGVQTTLRNANTLEKIVLKASRRDDQRKIPIK